MYCHVGWFDDCILSEINDDDDDDDYYYYCCHNSDDMSAVDLH